MPDGRRSADAVRDAYALEQAHRAPSARARASTRASERGGATFTFRDVRYDVRGSKDGTSRAILRGVWGAASPGEVLALMGPTGSGKTSLLNVLAGRVPASGGVARGTILVDEKPREETFMREKVAYVMQEELLFPHLTVEETLTLHCRLRRAALTEAQVEASVSEIIGELGLTKVRQSPVGAPGSIPRGVSGGERKRVNIGVELVGDPEAIFLDEPTSGLDSFQAQRCIFALRALAQTGRTVVCTIHQPRSSIYAMFTQLLLISEGRLLYIGDAQQAVEYFSQLKFECPHLTNPADFFMDITSVDVRNPEREKSSRARIEFFAAEAAERRLGEKAIERSLEKHRARTMAASTRDDEDTTHASWIKQFILLTQRGSKNQRRNVIGVGVTLVIELVYAAIAAVLFRGVGYDQKGIQDRIGCLFFVTLNVAYTAALPVINVFSVEKAIVVRERSSGAYQWAPYYVSKYVAELPKLISRLAYTSLIYWVVGLRRSAYNFWVFVAVVITEVMSMTAAGLLMASAMPVGAALALGPAFITIFSLFGGIYLNMNSIPDGAKWIRFINPIYYAYGALVANEFGGDDLSFSCDASDGRCLTTGKDVLELYAFADVKIGIFIMAQFLLQIGLHLLAYLGLLRASQQFLPLSAVTPKEDVTAEEDSSEGNENRKETV